MTSSSDFIRQFLFRGSEIHHDGNTIRSSILMDSWSEGWVGIPHGGIGMGAVFELAMMAVGRPADLPYPLSVDFRMGGAKARIGDIFEAEASFGGSEFVGRITVKDRDAPPYLTASIHAPKDDERKQALFLSYMPGSFSDIREQLTPLPHYRNCFVCGRERKDPGLRRRFYLSGDPGDGGFVVSPVGFDAGDCDDFYLFARNGIAHPVASLALLDEAMGWGGFMITGSGGVTVRASYTFYRNVRMGERLVVFGRGESKRGSAGSRLLFWGSGGIAAVNRNGGLEPLAVATGQWIGMAELTEQMKTELIPKELTKRAFQAAGY
ncbi:MAG: hotdog domain-containing protein [Syntrophales bacterium]